MRRISYNNASVYVSPDYTGQSYNSGEIKQIKRVQSAPISITFDRRETSSLGQYEQSRDLLETPIVNLELEYFTTDGYNEQILGFYTNGLSGAISKLVTSDKDYFIKYKNDTEQDYTTICLGNGVIERYGFRAAIGDFCRSTVYIKGFNMSSVLDTSGQTARVDVSGNLVNNTYDLPEFNSFFIPRESGAIEETTAIGHSNVVVDFGSGMIFGLNTSGTNGFLQSFEFDINLQRNEVVKIGNKYPLHRGIKFPVDVNFSANFFITKRQADNLLNHFCGSSSLDLTLFSNCYEKNVFWENKRQKKLKFHFENLKLESQSESLNIGEKKRITLNWKGKINKPNFDYNGFIIEGDFGSSNWLLGFDSGILNQEQWESGNGSRPILDYFQFFRKTNSSDFNPSYEPRDFFYSLYQNYNSYFDKKPTVAITYGPNNIFSGEKMPFKEKWIGYIENGRFKYIKMADFNGTNGAYFNSDFISSDSISFAFDSGNNIYIANEAFGGIDIYSGSLFLTGFEGKTPQLLHNDIFYSIESGKEVRGLNCYYIKSGKIYYRNSRNFNLEYKIEQDFPFSPYLLKHIERDYTLSGFHDAAHIFGLFENTSGFCLKIEPKSYYNDFSLVEPNFNIVGKNNSTDLSLFFITGRNSEGQDLMNYPVGNITLLNSGFVIGPGFLNIGYVNQGYDLLNYNSGNISVLNSGNNLFNGLFFYGYEGNGYDLFDYNIGLINIFNSGTNLNTGELIYG